MWTLIENSFHKEVYVNLSEVTYMNIVGIGEGMIFVKALCTIVCKNLVAERMLSECSAVSPI